MWNQNQPLILYSTVPIAKMNTIFFLSAFVISKDPNESNFIKTLLYGNDNLREAQNTHSKKCYCQIPTVIYTFWESSISKQLWENLYKLLVKIWSMLNQTKTRTFFTDVYLFCAAIISIILILFHFNLFRCLPSYFHVSNWWQRLLCWTV